MKINKEILEKIEKGETQFDKEISSDCQNLAQYLKLEFENNLELDSCVHVPIEISDQAIDAVFEAIVEKKPDQIIPQNMINRKYCIF